MSLAPELATVLGVFVLAFVVRLLASDVTDAPTPCCSSSSDSGQSSRDS